MSNLPDGMLPGDESQGYDDLLEKLEEFARISFESGEYDGEFAEYISENGYCEMVALTLRRGEYKDEACTGIWLARRLDAMLDDFIEYKAKRLNEIAGRR